MGMIGNVFKPFIDFLGIFGNDPQYEETAEVTDKDYENAKVSFDDRIKLKEALSSVDLIGKDIAKYADSKSKGNITKVNTTATSGGKNKGGKSKGGTSVQAAQEIQRNERAKGGEEYGE